MAASTVHVTDSWQVSIDDLPDEILIKIFSYMTFSELIEVVQKVCSHWKRLSQDQEIWADKVYYVEDYFKCWCIFDCNCDPDLDRTTDREVIQMFCDAPNLRTVNMQRAAKSRVFRVLYNRCHRLCELHLDSTQKLSYSVLKNLVEKCPRIHTLGISNELLKSEKFSKVVSRLQHLRVLSLVVCYPQKRTPVLRPLGDGCPQLTEVNFRHMTVDMDDLWYFVNAKRKMLKSICIKWTMTENKSVVPLLTVCADSLEHLELNKIDEVPEDVREAFIALGNLKNLQVLKISLTYPPPPGVAALAFKTGGLPKLTLLELRDGNGFDDDTIIAISHGCPALQEFTVRDAERLSDAAFSQIHHLEHLEKLIVSHCKGLGGALVPYLTRLPRLHSLWIENMEFPTLQPGLSSIVELSGLRSLSLNFSLVTGMPFDEFPGKLVSLRTLWIVRCRGDPKAIDALTEKMPDLKIHGSIELEEPALDT